MCHYRSCSHVETLTKWKTLHYCHWLESSFLCMFQRSTERWKMTKYFFFENWIELLQLWNGIPYWTRQCINRMFFSKLHCNLPTVISRLLHLFREIAIFFWCRQENNPTLSVLCKSANSVCLTEWITSSESYSTFLTFNHWSLPSLSTNKYIYTVIDEYCRIQFASSCFDMTSATSLVIMTVVFSFWYAFKYSLSPWSIFYERRIKKKNNRRE